MIPAPGHQDPLYQEIASKKLIFMFVFLCAEAKAIIEGPSEKYIKAGSRLQLVCIFHNLTEVPQTVFW
jgi:hypothetical protein